MRGFLLKGRRGTEIPLIFYVKEMISKDIVKNIVLSVTGNTTIFVVDVKISGANKISVEVDKPEGITIDDCVKISRAIESELDREKEDFELVVSSPGLSEPFKVMEQYRKNLGQQVEVVQRDGHKIIGLLQHTDDEGILVEVQTKNKEAGQKRQTAVMQTVEIKFSDIKATKRWII